MDTTWHVQPQTMLFDHTNANGSVDWVAVVGHQKISGNRIPTTQGWIYTLGLSYSESQHCSDL